MNSMSESDRGRHWPRHRSISSRRQVAAVTRSPALPAAWYVPSRAFGQNECPAVAITASACSEDGASGWRGGPTGRVGGKEELTQRTVVQWTDGEAAWGAAWAEEAMAVFAVCRGSAGGHSIDGRGYEPRP